MTLNFTKVFKRRTLSLLLFFFIAFFLTGIYWFAATPKFLFNRPTFWFYQSILFNTYSVEILNVTDNTVRVKIDDREATFTYGNLSSRSSNLRVVPLKENVFHAQPSSYYPYKLTMADTGKRAAIEYFVPENFRDERIVLTFSEDGREFNYAKGSVPTLKASANSKFPTIRTLLSRFTIYYNYLLEINYNDRIIYSISIR